MTEPKTPPFPNPSTVTLLHLAAELRGVDEATFMKRWRQATNDGESADVRAHFFEEACRRSRVACEPPPVDFGE